MNNVKIDYDIKVETNKDSWVPILKDFMKSNHKNMRIYCSREKIRNAKNSMINYKRRNKEECQDIVFSANGEYLYVVKVSEYIPNIGVTYDK